MFVWEFIQENRYICYSAINPCKDSRVIRTAGNMNGKPSGLCPSPWGYVCAGWSACCGNSVLVTIVLGCSSMYPTCALTLAWGPGVGQGCVCHSSVLTLLIAPVLKGEHTGLLCLNHALWKGAWGSNIVLHSPVWPQSFSHKRETEGVIGSKEESIWYEEILIRKELYILERTKLTERVNINSVGTFGMTECFLAKERERDWVNVIIDFEGRQNVSQLYSGCVYVCT